MEKYASKNIGRHDFQIDLGIALLNQGIRLDWDGDERPAYVQVGELVPCNCNTCHFCIDGYTSGIAYKKRACVTVEYKCNTRMKTDKCSEKRVNLNNGCDYCNICYRMQDVGLTVTEEKSMQKCTIRLCYLPGTCVRHMLEIGIRFA